MSGISNLGLYLLNTMKGLDDGEGQRDEEVCVRLLDGSEVDFRFRLYFLLFVIGFCVLFLVCFCCCCLFLWGSFVPPYLLFLTGCVFGWVWGRREGGR